MYLTAQLVRAREGRTGFNAALYEHTSGSMPGVVWTRPAATLLKEIAERYPGTRVRERIDVSPGGNAVECFLDMAARDLPHETAIIAAVDALRREAVDSPRPVVHVGNVWATYCTFLGDENPIGSLNALANVALDLFRGQRVASAEPPLRVVVSHDDERWRFSLDDDSANRVRVVGGHPVVVTIRFDVAEELRNVSGPIYPSVAEWTTALSLDQLTMLGGVEFVNEGGVLGTVVVSRKVP